MSLKWLFVFLTIDLDLWCWIMGTGKHGLTSECNADDYFCSQQLKKGTNLLFQNLEENCSLTVDLKMSLAKVNSCKTSAAPN